jgi:hypothetical protein
MGFLISEFATVPEPPQEYRHQQGAMTIVGYPVEEGANIAAGTPIAILENWWARFELICLAPGRVVKNLYDSTLGIAVPSGTPISFLFFEPDDLPKQKPLFELRHHSDLRPRPSRKRAA